MSTKKSHNSTGYYSSNPDPTLEEASEESSSVSGNKGKVTAVRDDMFISADVIMNQKRSRSQSNSLVTSSSAVSSHRPSRIYGLGELPPMPPLPLLSTNLPLDSPAVDTSTSHNFQSPSPSSPSKSGKGLLSSRSFMSNNGAGFFSGGGSGATTAGDITTNSDKISSRKPSTLQRIKRHFLSKTPPTTTSPTTNPSFNVDFGVNVNNNNLSFNPSSDPDVDDLTSAMDSNQATSKTAWKSKFTKALQEEYLQYYYPSYVRQWQMIARVETAFAIAFGLYGLLNTRSVAAMEQLDSDNRLEPGNLVKMGNLVLPLLSVGMLFACLFEMLSPLTPKLYDRNSAFPIHLACQLVYGSCLAIRDLFTDNLDPAGYIYCFLAFLYTNVVPDVRPNLAVGLSVVTLNIIGQSVKANQNPDICLGQSSCTQVIVVNALFMFMANLIGFIFSYIYYMDTRKQFYSLYNLWEEKRLLTEAGDKAEAIALSIIPKGVWEDFRKGEKIDLNGILSNPLYSYRNVSILFGDVVGFTTLSAAVSADTLVQLLNSVFLEFDIIVEQYGLEKIKTLGDCYMLCGGLPEPITYSSLRTVYVGSKMIRIVSALTALQPVALQLRVGIHTGDVVAGILGEERIIFDVWSTDVSIASLMEQSGKPSWVHVSQETKNQLEGYCSLRVGPVVRFQDRDLPSYFFNDIEDRGRAVLDFILQQNMGSGGVGNGSSSNNNSNNNNLKGSSSGKGWNEYSMETGAEFSGSRRGTVTSISAGRRGTITGSIPQNRRASFLDSDGKAAKGIDRGLLFGNTKGRITVEGYANKNPFIRHVQEITKELSQKINSFWITFNDGDEKEYARAISFKYNGRLIVSLSFIMTIFVVTGLRNILLGIGIWSLGNLIVILIGLLMIFYAYSKIYGLEFELMSRSRTRGVVNGPSFGILKSSSSTATPGSDKKDVLMSMIVSKRNDNNLNNKETNKNQTNQDSNSSSSAASFPHKMMMHLASYTFDHTNGFPLFFLVSAMTLITALLAVSLDGDGHSVHAEKKTLSGDVYLFIMSALLFTRHHWLHLVITSFSLLFIYQVVHGIVSASEVVENRYSSLGFMLVLLAIVAMVSRRMELNVRLIHLLKVDLRRRKLEVDDVRIKTEKLLYRLLPKHVVDRLKRNPDREISDYISSAGIMFVAIHHFKDTDVRSISILNDIIGKFDQMLTKYDVEKIKTIGSSATYMAACGLFDSNHSRSVATTFHNREDDDGRVRDGGGLASDPLDISTSRQQQAFQLEFANADSEEELSTDHDGKVVPYEIYRDDKEKHQIYRKFVKYAIALREKMVEINDTYKSDYKVQIGIHVGPLVAGVIGKSKFAYDVWGDTVNVASRMETSAEPGQIQVSEKVYLLLKDDFMFGPSEIKSIKGKGNMRTYKVIGSLSCTAPENPSETRNGIRATSNILQSGWTD